MPAKVLGNSFSKREPRKWAEISGFVRIVRPAGLDSEAVASSANPINAAPMAIERAPGGKKVSCTLGGSFVKASCANADGPKAEIAAPKRLIATALFRIVPSQVLTWQRRSRAAQSAAERGSWTASRIDEAQYVLFSSEVSIVRPSSESFPISLPG